MTKPFNKAVVFTDIHFGRNSNNPQANQDNIEFINWFVQEAKAWGADTCIFCGDWHDNRYQTQALTMDFSLQGLEIIDQAFDKTWVIPGNHDLFYRDRRDIASVAFAKKFKNIDMIMDPMTIDDVTFLPWLVGDEHKKFKDLDSRYVFSHLEVPGFLMNAKVEMADSAHAVKADNFVGQEYVFTGHFHMRQSKGNIVYTGNVMPFNFSDNWDEDRGMMFLEYGMKPVFKAWPGQPLFRTMNLSELLENPDKFLREKLTARVSIDIDISYEEAQLIKDTFIDQYKMRKIELLKKSQIDEGTTTTVDVKLQSVDQIVIEGLKSVNSTGIRSDKLISLYEELS